MKKLKSKQARMVKTPLHVLRGQLDKLENELRQLEKYYAKESRKYRRVVRSIHDIKVKAAGIEQERDRVRSLLEHHERKAGEAVPGERAGRAAENTGSVGADSSN